MAKEFTRWVVTDVNKFVLLISAPFVAFALALGGLVVLVSVIRSRYSGDSLSLIPQAA